MREILISTEGKDAAGVAAAEKKARDLSARAKKGEKFPELARANSDSATKEQYGELGGFKRGELNKQIEDIVFAADRGSVTDPIRVANGFLILKVEEKHKAGLASFEEVEQEVMNEMIQPKFPGQVREYLTKLRMESFLEIKPGYVDSGAAEGKNTAWTDPAQLKPETVTKAEVQNQPRKRRMLGIVPIPGTIHEAGQILKQVSAHEISLCKRVAAEPGCNRHPAGAAQRSPAEEDPASLIYRLRLATVPATSTPECGITPPR